MNRSRNDKGNDGFTLVELLVVIVIMVILLVAASPAISSLLGSENTSRNVCELSDTLELARQYAVANNTYVWAAFSTQTAANGMNSVTTAVFSSNDGTDPAGTSSWITYNYGAVPNSQISLVSKVITLKQISIQNADYFQGAGTSVTSLPAAPSVTSANSIVTLSSPGFFTMTLPGTGAPANFTQAIEFSPSGQARNTTTPTSVIDLDVQPQKGSVNDTKNIAVLRVNGLTGQTVIYRQ